MTDPRLTEAAAPGAEPPEARLKRLRMRAWRRGTKEMDLVLGPFADARLATLAPADLDIFDAILSENDQDLLQYVLGQSRPPAAIGPLMDEIAGFARQRLSATARDGT